MSQLWSSADELVSEVLELHRGATQGSRERG